MISHYDAGAIRERLAALGLGEPVAIEAGRLVFGTDDLAGVRVALWQT